MGGEVEFMAWRERGAGILREAEGRRHAGRTGAVLPLGRSCGRLRSVLGFLCWAGRRGRLARGTGSFGRRGATAQRAR